MKFYDVLYNRWLLAKYKVEYQTFPKINGRLLISFCDATVGTFRLGKNVIINSSIQANPVGGCRTVLQIKGDNAIIEIGDRTGISNAIICARQSVKIGRDVFLGAGCQIFDTDFHSLDLEQRIANTHIPCKPVFIEDGVFIGSNALIMKGVTIGQRAVIGAHSVVTKNIGPGEIWAGNPAKYIKTLSGD